MALSSLIPAYTTYLRTVDFSKLSTIKNRLYEVKIFLNYLESDGKTSDFTKINHLEYLAFRYARKNYKISYTNKIMVHLQNFYQFLLFDGHIKVIPGWLEERGRKEQTIPEVLSMYEIFLIEKQFSGTVKDLRDAAIIEILLSTGLRINEALSIMYADYVNNDFSAITKGDRQRLFIVNETAKSKITAYLKKRSVFSPFLFSNQRGGKLTTSYIDKMIREKCQGAGIKRRISAHSFRHTYASLLMEGGANLIEVRDLLGHASVTTTEIYAKTSTDHLREELRRCHPAW